MKLVIQAAAEADIIRQFEWYAEQALFDVARRFRAATQASIEALASRPLAGAPRPIGSPRLAGLRSWPVQGFHAFRVYYIPQPELVTVLRVLCGKRDLGMLLGDMDVHEPNGC